MATAPEESEANSQARPLKGFEYLDHTADVQLHSWAPSLKEAFEQAAKAMFGYITDLDTIEEQETLRIETTGHDLQSALYNFLDELLYNFCAEPFFTPFKIEITEFERPVEAAGDDDEIRIKAVCFGEPFQLGKHPQGTEIKAITYSAMQIIEEEDQVQVFVIVDI